MPWQQERNRFSLSPHGNKGEGFAARGLHDTKNSVPCPDMPPGLTSMSPLNAAPNDRGEPGRGPVKVMPGRMPEHRPPGLLRDSTYGHRLCLIALTKARWVPNARLRCSVAHLL
jgi:hypothetical protein